MDFINDLFSQLTSLGPEMLVALIVIVLGYALRFIPQFPNKLIPLACVVLAAVLYPLLAKPGAADLAMRHPIVRQVLIGVLIGFLAWVGHNKFLKPLEDKFPFLTGFLDGDDNPPGGTPPGSTGGNTVKNIGILLAFFSLAALTGCTHVVGSRSPTGQLSLKATGFLTSTTGLKFAATDQNGFTTTLSLDSETADSAAIAALSGGLVDLAKTGLAFAAKAPAGLTNSPSVSTNLSRRP